MAVNLTNTQVDSELVPPMVTNIHIAFFGIFGNLSIIMATIKTKTLQSPCHILIAVNAWSESVALSSQFIYGYVILSGFNNIPLQTYARQWEVIIFGVLMVIVYVIIWVLIIVRKQQNIKTQQKLIKSLTVIMVTVLISWPITMFLYYLVVLVSPWWHIRMWCMYVSILMNLGMSLNYFIYFIFSTEHRSAFKRQLKCLFWIPFIKNAIGSSTKVQVTTIASTRPKVSVTVTATTRSSFN